MEQTKSDRATLSAERIKKSTPWFLAAVILIVLFIGFGLSFSAEKRQRGHAFVDALREERFDDAFGMCTPELQETLVDAEGLRQKTNVEALPESFWWTEVDSVALLFLFQVAKIRARVLGGLCLLGCD